MPPSPLVDAFRGGLGEVGYVEGKNVAFEHRTVGGEYERFRAIADDFVRSKVAVIFATGGTAAAVAAKSVTSITPDVFYMGVPGQAGPRHQPQPTGREPYWPGMAGFCAGSEATRTAPRTGLECNCHLAAAKSEKSRQRVRGTRCAGGRRQAWARSPLSTACLSESSPDVFRNVHHHRF
jgi:hypothetical protein